MLIDKKTTLLRAALMMILLSLLSVSCSASPNDNSGGNKKNKKTEQTLIFKSGENQDKYEAVFSDGKLTSLSKNGKQLSKDEMKENEDLVYDNLNELRHHDGEDNDKGFTFNFNDKEFAEQMKHLGEHMKHLGHNFPHMFDKLNSIKIDIDTIITDEKMKELDHKLSGLKNMKIRVFSNNDEDDFDIPDIEFNEKDLNLDMDKLQKDLDKAGEDIKKSTETMKNIDIPRLTEKIKEEMKSASLSLKKSKKELHKLSQFMDELKQELVKDNLIKNKDEKVNLKITDGDIYVNDKKLTDDLQKKYKKMYQDKFGHNMMRNFHLNMNDD
jgi:methyl-accepting chemotaxis protein